MMINKFLMDARTDAHTPEIDFDDKGKLLQLEARVRL